MTTRKTKSRGGYAAPKRLPFCKARGMDGVWLVLRLDDYSITRASRGQFYPLVQRSDDANKAIWGTEADAVAAATWATQKFGNEYGVFKLTHYLVQATAPVNITRV